MAKDIQLSIRFRAQIGDTFAIHANAALVMEGSPSILLRHNNLQPFVHCLIDVNFFGAADADEIVCGISQSVRQSFVSCDQIQGYLFSRPVDAASYAERFLAVGTTHFALESAR